MKPGIFDTARWSIVTVATTVFVVGLCYAFWGFVYSLGALAGAAYAIVTLGSGIVAFFTIPSPPEEPPVVLSDWRQHGIFGDYGRRNDDSIR